MTTLCERIENQTINKSRNVISFQDYWRPVRVEGVSKRQIIYSRANSNWGLALKRLVESDARGQSTFLPASLDDYVDEYNPVRVIDAFVDALDLEDRGFEGVVPGATGRPVLPSVGPP